MKKIAVLILFAVLLFAAVGCSKGKESVPQSETNANVESDLFEQFKPKSDPNLKGKITIWAVVPGYFELIVPHFNKYYPNVEVEVVAQVFETIPRTLNAIYAGKGGPDIVQIVHGGFSQFTALDGGLENLYEEPYNAGRFKQYYPEGDWNRWHTLDGQLWAMPFSNDTQVYYYRKDIMEEYGYPSEPEEFGEYIQDKDNWFSLAETMKNDGRFLLPSVDSLYYWFMENRIYDENLDIVILNDQNAEAMDIAKEIMHKGYSMQIMFGFDPESGAHLNGGRLIALPSTGSHGDWIGNYAPDTKGKWGASRLPFGANYTGTGAGNAILSQSKNKEAAWAFLEYMHTTLEAQLILAREFKQLQTFKPLWEIDEYVNHQDEYLDGQLLRKQSLQIIDEAEPLYAYPVNVPANEILIDIFRETAEQNLDSRAQLQKAASQIEAVNKEQRERLLELKNRGTTK